MASDLHSLLQRWWQRAEEQSWTRGITGKYNADGNVALRTGRRGYIYVRIVQGDQITVTTAKNMGTALRPHVPVRMREVAGEMVIFGPDPAGVQLQVLLGNGETSSLSVPYHTHGKFSGMEYEVPGWFLEPGRVRYSGSGLVATINTFRYFHAGAWKTWEEGTIDLAAYQPAGPDEWCWVLIGVDPDTNAAVAVAGATVGTGTALDVEDLDDIDFQDYIPCGAFQLKDDDTKLSAMGRWADAHGWFGDGANTLTNTIDAIMTDADAAIMVDADGNVMTEG